MKHTEITRESVIQSITDGAKTISQVAMSHGYAKPISGGITKKIRTIVPDIAELLASSVVKSVVTAPIEAPIATPINVHVAIPVVAPVVAPVAAPVATSVVQAEVAPAVAPKIKSTIVCGTYRKVPYGGKLYGRVFTEAISAGRTEFRPFVKAVAEKLGLTENQVFVAANVMRIPHHQSNGNRSKDIAGERGFMQLVAIEKVDKTEVTTEKIAG